MAQDKTRWQKAQSAEFNFWKQKYTPPEKYSERFVEAELKKIGLNLASFRHKTVLEIGCGPKGPINFLPPGKKYGLDPLMDEYLESGCYSKKDVEYIKGKGEKTDFESNFFDIVICYNVLDHCEDPIKTLNEVWRILKKNGVLFLEVHVVKNVGPFLVRLLNRSDTCHPHHFKARSLKKELIKSNFKIESERLIPFTSNRSLPVRVVRKMFWEQYYVLAKK